MNLREEIIALKVKEVMSREKQYAFPQFMRLVRKSLGMTRKAIANMLQVSESKINYLENGKFTRGPDLEFVATLAHFYGLEGPFVMKKLDNYREFGR